MKAKQPPGPPMDLANMRRQGVHHLIAAGGGRAAE
jgi:hypothetical protein